MARIRSPASRTRVRGSVPWLRISSRFQPIPTPNSNRPPLRWSTLATSLAVTIGSRSITRQTPLPIRSRLVASAAAVNATNRSYVCQYFCGSCAPPGQGVSRLAGMCVCSANQSAVWPRSSTRRAISPGRRPSCVGK
jgi:hypothetical protein